jgi:uncharacterized protein (TIGR02145 family)
MPEDFLIGKKSLLKVDSNRNYVKENKTQLSVDVDILKNKNYNRFDVSKDPLSVLLNNPPVSTLDFPIADYINIGGQLWVVKNVTTSVYKNGDTIPQVTDNTQWDNLTTGAWCWYNNDPANESIYGKLYNWYAVTDSRGISPNGYHVATSTEWSTISSYLTSVGLNGGALKSLDVWSSPNTGATNSTGFGAIPGGFRNFNGGVFSNLNLAARFWTTEDVNVNNGRSYALNYNSSTLSTFSVSKKYGYSVRFLKDQ